MANIGYIQVVRHCNHFCGFCSNPSTPWAHDIHTMKLLVDDFRDRGYFGVILTGGEPTLHPELPTIAAYARQQGLHVRMITNGHRLADLDFARDLADAGMAHVHISVYSTRPAVEAELRGTPDTLERAFAAVENAHAVGMVININSVINALNADHLHESVSHWMEHHPYVRHFVWNNLDPSMGRAESNQAKYTPRLADFQLSLYKACQLLHASGRSFRVEKVPLCYMSDFAWASTETRKIVKGEERIVHFLDHKQTVRQTDWEHLYADACGVCSVREICGGLFDRGGGYDPAELYPLFINRDPIIRTIIEDPADPSYPLRTLATWRSDFEKRLGTARNHHAERSTDAKPAPEGSEHLPVGGVTPASLKRFDSKRRAEQRRADSLGITLEKPATQPDEGNDEH